MLRKGLLFPKWKIGILDKPLIGDSGLPLSTVSAQTSVVVGTADQFVTRLVGFLAPHSEVGLDGQTALSDDGYAVGLPELIVEVASSSESIDLNAKRNDYERAGVLEYVVVVIRQRAVRWFVLQDGQYEEQQVDADGIFKSSVFPGLWLQQTALLQLEGSQVMEILRHGLESPEHARFVQQLQLRREISS